MFGKKLLLVAVGVMGASTSAYGVIVDPGSETSLPSGRPPHAPLGARLPKASPPSAPLLQKRESTSEGILHAKAKDTSALSSQEDLSSQLLDEKTEKFYKELMADQYAAFRTIQCVSKSISVEKKQFEAGVMQSMRNKLKKNRKFSGI